ncbi:hypothetical protein SH668x_003573 [Planctomicrobium sp. SH668]|uniref:hypothetical protein n=1 Tax=Planctomicrobium sp. SH668 TaxID=3448126 RepID=UPI003F5BFE0A
MSSQTWVVIIGGLIPAIGLGIAGVFQKLAGQAGIATGLMLMLAGLATSIVGAVVMVVEKEYLISGRAASLAFLFGSCWAISNALIIFTLRKLGGTISQLAPLYNMNTLVVVFIGLLFLAEWKTVQPTRVLIASVLIVMGGIVASKA